MRLEWNSVWRIVRTSLVYAMEVVIVLLLDVEVNMSTVTKISNLLEIKLWNVTIKADI